MARTAAANTNKLTSVETYNKLPSFRKRLTWLYYRGEETHNREGLNGYDVPGSATDFQSCGVVKDYIDRKNFRYWAKVSKRLNQMSSHSETFINLFTYLFVLFSSYFFIFIYYRKQLSFQQIFTQTDISS